MKTKRRSPGQKSADLAHIRRLQKNGTTDDLILSRLNERKKPDGSSWPYTVTEKMLNGDIKEVARRRRDRQRERDLAIVSECVSMGWTSQMIADHLNKRKQPDGAAWPYTVTRQTVDKDIIECKKRWAARSDDAIEVHVGMQEAEYDKLKGVYYDGYAKSQADAQRKQFTKITSGDTDDEGAPLTPEETSSLETKTQVGDIDFLRGVERMLTAKSALRGLHAPVKIAHTDHTGHKTVEAPPDDSSRTLALMKQLRGVGVEVVDDESGEVAE